MAKNMVNSMSNMSWSNPLVVVIMLLVILIVVLAVFRSASPFLNLGFGVNAHLGELKASFQLEAFDNSGSEQPLFVMYYAEWCSHCKKAKPEFQRLIEEYKGNVKLMMVDCMDDSNKELAESQGIKGFPTIRYYKNGLNGPSDEYSGERTYSNFAQYLGGITGVNDTMPDNASPIM
jgi:thiol-disulfide isomerase/thioredoxin